MDVHRPEEAVAEMPPHACSSEQVLARLAVEPRQGLSAEEAAARLARHGPNALPAPKRSSALKRFLLQFHNVLIYVLLAAGGVTALTGHWVDAGVILGVVVINAIIGYIQEGKAEQALDAIRDMLSPHAAVRRDGHRREIEASELVPGDIVFLASGDRVPADLRLVEARNFRVDESALTGESLAVEKGLAPVGAQAALGDRSSMAYSGTLVVSGQASAVVVATGAATEIGRIGALLDSVEALSTPLLRQLAAFGRMLTWIILVVAAAALGFGVLARGYALDEMFLAAVGLAVAAIPEGLPAIVTITLAIGVQRMACRHAIVRRLPAVEALGAVTVICSDKTGTLTRNEMAVRRLLTGAGLIEVSGPGYAPQGGFSRQGDDLDADGLPLLRDIACAALLCNDASVRQDGADWVLLGDPTEGALLGLAGKAGLEFALERERLPRVDVIPFESEHRFMATLHRSHQGPLRIYLKGAPERVLALCDGLRGEGGEAQPLESDALRAGMDGMAAEGMRLLAIAERTEPAGGDGLDFAGVEAGGFTLLAVCGLSDPPREEAVKAVARCLDAGIRVKMITGDHAATACAIGRQLGLGHEVKALTGEQIEALDDTALAVAVQDTDIFARASPEHKLRLVQALQSRGEVVAMTGDGVNDAPALKRADVGVAMGRKGTEAAKEAAEMVLADDNFASVAAAVEEGRTVYDNLRKAIAYILPTNLGQAAMVFFAVLFGMIMPITPVQILWVNMITAVTLALALAFEPPEDDIMRRPPRSPGEPLLDRFIGWRILFVGGLLVAGSMAIFAWELRLGASVELARTAAVNTLFAGELFYLFNMRSFTAPVLNREGLLGNRYVLLAAGVLVLCQLLFTYLPAMQSLFGSAALAMDSWWRILAFGLGVLLIVELEKALLRHVLKARPQARV
ncbi:HAD-IC family P-type ATPase [Azoarcus indigens]|uniref:Calcium-translocating P-type ATPase/potassium/sodium efflux P-type ATPase,TIGR01523 n=1 Tax=Azoarcus indigens TaxID=29545 RepID=A0A4R6DR59_9RHOO|nr:cation-transporting P-type ATPase [Azoarcus indigens]NMG66304.1 HAD-IC family P-type ATPase [Azoarcus indigens]TDN47561.1 calcium-translocating P-type ATPase/potassium/sodium efflux P-type ATPase,TIGR01523 [Azoarcus indigens]